MTKRAITVAPAASDDLAAILEYALATLGIEAALALDRRLDDAMRSLAEHAERGRVVPELRQRGIVLYRELVVLPHRVVYRALRREVWIVALVDHRRYLDALLYERARRDALR